jgi:hypothetical protein
MGGPCVTRLLSPKQNLLVLASACCWARLFTQQIVGYRSARVTRSLTEPKEKDPFFLSSSSASSSSSSFFFLFI